MVDVVHLCFRSPFGTGSFNRSLPAIVDQINELTHKVVSSVTTHPIGASKPDWLELVGKGDLLPYQRWLLKAPARLRNGVRPSFPADEEVAAYATAVLDLLRDLRPRIVICYDDHKLVRQLRPVLTEETSVIFSQHGYSYFLSTQEATRLYSLQVMDRIIVQSMAAYQFERSRLPAYEPIVEVVENSVDTTFFRPPTVEEERLARERWTSGHGPIVSSVGRLVPKKGAHVLLEAWDQIAAAYPGSRLVVAGDGPSDYERHLRDASPSRTVRDVIFVGRLQPADVRELLWASDVYILPTLFCEGFPRSVIEAMASGTPVVCSTFPAAREQLHERCVLLVDEPNCPNEFAVAVIELLQTPEEIERLRKEVRRVADERFCEERWIADLRAVYQRALSARQ